jgi:hypothetical protein
MVDWPGTPQQPQWPGSPVKQDAAQWPGTPIKQEAAQWPGTPQAAPTEQPSFTGDVAKAAGAGWEKIKEGATQPGMLRVPKILGGASEILGAPISAAGSAIERQFPAIKQAQEAERPWWSPKLESPAEVIGTGIGLIGGKAIKPGLAEKPPTPIGPSREFVTQQENALHQIVQASEADKLDILKKTEALPEETKNPVMQEKFYHHIEEPNRAPIVGFRKDAAEIEKKLPPVSQGMTRLWRGNKPGEIGTATQFTNDLPGIALPFRKAYSGDISYVDVPSSQLSKFEQRVGAAAKAEFNLPPEIAKQALKVDHVSDARGLTDYEKTMFDQTVGLIQKERAETYNRITQAGYPIEELTSQVHRVVKGKAPQFDQFEGSAAADPIMGLGRGLPRVTSSMMERKYFALEDQNGNRFVVAKSDAGGTLFHGGKETPTTIPHEITPGNSFSIGGKNFKVVQATTKEIEENSTTRYYKNAWANTADDLVRLKRVERGINYLEQLKTTPEWQQFATMDKMKAPPDWIPTKLPQLEGWRMHPKLAHVFDDFYGGRSVLAEKIAKINRFATRSIFWQPNPHIENVLGHWYTGRGWDWITPYGLRSLFVDGAKAIKHVVTLDKEYQQMLREGSALQLARVANQDFYQQLAKRVGMEFEKDPNRWGNIFKTMGFNGIADGVNAYYNGVSKVLWGANDIFMMQRVLELERKGLTRVKAIKEAEKHIPPYRIPSEVMRSRAWSELMQNPSIFIFNRYHYGVWKAYANVLKDLHQGTPKEKFDALGNMVALGVLSFVIYPYISEGLQKLTGDPNVKKLARGPASIPTGLYELWQGDRSLGQFISSVMTFAPGTKEIGEFMSNLDWFTGRHIVEPDDLKNGRWGRVAAQIVNHAAETMVSPYQVLDQYVKDKDAKGPIRVAIDQLVGMKEPTERQLRGKAAAQAIQAKEAAKRAAKPRGLIESFGGPWQ